MIAIKQAVILAGGMGTRLKPLTDKIPKPMVPINDKPFLQYLIELLRENEIFEIVLLTGHLHEKIEEYFGDGSKFGVGIKYSVGDDSFDTGTRLKNAEKILDDYFLLMYCDNYWPLNLIRLMDFYNSQKVPACLTVYKNSEAMTKNNMQVDDSGFVIKYDKSRKDNSTNCVDIGFYIIDKNITRDFPGYNFSFEEIIIPKLIGSRQLAAYVTEHKYWSIGTFEKIRIAGEFLKPRKIIFLDRDGVINSRPSLGDYVKKWSEFQFLDGAIEALKILMELDCEIYVISNQSGIARGLMTEQDLKDIHDKMEGELEIHGVKIGGIYYCPHGWENTCECRKPKAGMFYRASREHNINLSKSVFIGDDERDMHAGNSIDCKTFMVTPQKNLLEIVKELKASGLI